MIHKLTLNQKAEVKEALLKILPPSVFHACIFRWLQDDRVVVKTIGSVENQVYAFSVTFTRFMRLQDFRLKFHNAQSQRLAAKYQLRIAITNELTDSLPLVLKLHGF